MGLFRVTLGQLRMYDEFEKEQERIKQILDELTENRKTQNLDSMIYTTMYNTKLDFDIDRGFFSEALTYLDEIEDHFDLHSDLLDTNAKMVIFINLSYVHFGNQNYHKSLFWINKLLNNSYGNIRMDLQCMAPIMNIAIHYQLGNYDIISNLIRSTDRFLIKTERKFKVESSFLKFARKCLQEEYSKNNLEHLFIAEIENLKKISLDPKERGSIELFDIISWLESIVKNRPLEEIMKDLPEQEKTYSGIL